VAAVVTEPRRLRPFDRAPLERPAPEVAPDLLGALLVRDLPEGRIVVRLVEVEAYDGAGDPASHAFRGQTERNAVMFGRAGHAYVYFTYGMHFCLNVSCRPPGRASAVLLRAGSVVDGLELARERRPTLAERDLARGPGRLCRLLGVDRSQNGADLCRAAGPLRLAAGPPVDVALVRSGPRVGVARAAERPWRWWIDGSREVSAYKRGTRAGRAAG
jgi:DNA-3-methyladenine glycosylase